MKETWFLVMTRPLTLAAMPLTSTGLPAVWAWTRGPVGKLAARSSAGRKAMRGFMNGLAGVRLGRNSKDGGFFPLAARIASGERQARPAGPKSHGMLLAEQRGF